MANSMMRSTARFRESVRCLRMAGRADMESSDKVASSQLLSVHGG